VFKQITKTALRFAGDSNDASFTNCTFENNTHRAIELTPGTLTNTAEYKFVDCLFRGNTVNNAGGAPGGGGAIRIVGSYFDVDIQGCAFIGNRAEGVGLTSSSNNTVDGGALYVSTDNTALGTMGYLTVYDSYFENNFAQDDGGAIIVLGAQWHTSIHSNIVNCTFYGNTIAGAHYGGSAPFIGNVWITDGSGGAINYFGLTESEITHCTFYNNGITGERPDGVTGSYLGTVGGGGAIGVDTGEWVKDSSMLPQMPTLTNNIFVGNYVIYPATQGSIDLINRVTGNELGPITERSRTGNVFVLPVCDRDIQGPVQGTDPRMFQNNGNIGYDNKNSSYYHTVGMLGYSNGICLSAGIQVKNVFTEYNNTANRGDPNTAIPTPYGGFVGASGSDVQKQCFIPSPTSNELYRDGSVPYVVEVPYDVLGNLRDTFPNAGAVEIYWTMFNPGTDANWTDAVPTEVENPDDPTEMFKVIQSLKFATNNAYYVMTSTSLPGLVSGNVIAMPRSAIEHTSPDHGFMGWRSSVPDLNWSGYAAWALAEGHPELTVQEFLANNPLSELSKDAFPLYQPGDVVESEKQILYAEWRLNEFRVDFDLNYDAVPVWYNSSEPGKEAPRINVITGSTIVAPSDPLRSGFVFMGWYKDAAYTDAWDFDVDTVTEDIILYADWELEKFTVRFDLNYDAVPVWYNSSEPGKEAPRINVITGSTIVAPLDPSRSGYTFEGWFKDDACTNVWNFAADTVTADTILYADWEAIPLTLDLVTIGSGEFFIDEAGGPEHTAVLYPGDVVVNFVITPAHGWKIGSVILVDGNDIAHDKTSDAIAGTLTISYNELASGTDTLTVTFLKIEDERPWYLLLLPLFIVLLLIFADDDEEVYGKVTRNGKGLAGVTVSYTLNGVPRTVVTDKDGDYSIDVDMGDVIAIDGMSEICVEKDRTKMDIKL
jgi:uncharacterized repeat protein (TIGR02543 family)